MYVDENIIMLKISTDINYVVTFWRSLDDLGPTISLTHQLATCILGYYLTVCFRASLNHKNAGQTKFIKSNSQR